MLIISLLFEVGDGQLWLPVMGLSISDIVGDG